MALMALLRHLAEQELKDVLADRPVAERRLQHAVIIWLSRILTRDTRHDLAIPFLAHFFTLSYLPHDSTSC